MIKISIILPTYNEKENIGVLIPSIEEVITNINTEIIVVDDSSPDGTAALANDINKKYNNIRVILRKKNKGFAPSLLKGFDCSRGEFIATMDADLCHDPKVLPKMVGYLENKTADIVIGSRYVHGSVSKGKPIIKKMASKSAQGIANFILGLKIKDTTNNFRVFRKEVYEAIKDDLHPTGNVLLTEFLYNAHKKKFKIKEIPIHFIEKRKDKTRMNLFKEVFNFVKTITKIKLNIK